MNKDTGKAILLIVASTVAFSLMGACVKFVKRLPFMEIVFMRSIIGLAIMLVVLPLSKGSFWGGRKRAALFMRGLSGTVALCFHFFSITRIPLGTAMLLSQTAPIFVVVMAAFLLKEHVSPPFFLLVILGFTGTALLVSPNFNAEPLACLAAVASGFFAAIAMITIRYIGADESILTIIFYFTLVASIFSAPVAIPILIMPGIAEWLALLGIGFFSFLGQIWFTSAFQIGPASVVSPFNYLTPVFSFVWGIMFWGEFLTFGAALGALLVMLTGILISYFAQYARRSGQVLT